ncbi:MAG: redoxin domain-containing protein [Gemmatimonadales bacterium]|jgi:hypothetical protein
MISLRRHLGFDVLYRFADGDLDDPREARSVQEHLQRCPKCRTELAFIYRLKRGAREISYPKPPDGLLERALARRAAGERVILPTEAPADQHLSTRVPALGAVLLLLAGLVAGFVVLVSGEASAGASMLRILPSEPAPGQRVEVEFRTPSALAGEPWVRLRGFYRTADDAPPRERLGTYISSELERQADGLFRGHLAIPPAAVYAVFAVEDPESEAVEAGNGTWEVLVRDRLDRPLFEALRQKFRAMEAANWRAALQTAREMTELYPDQPEGWYYRFFYEEPITEPEGADSLLDFHSSRLALLERHANSQALPSADELAALMEYARGLGASGSVKRWSARLEDEYPLHPAAVQERVVGALLEHHDNPKALLEALEAEWQRSGPAHELLGQQGFEAALRAGEPGAILKWAERYGALRPDRIGSIARMLSDRTAVREEGMRRLRRELARLSSLEEGDRPLTRSLQAQRRANEERSRQLLAALGEALVASGRTRAGLDTLYLAAERGWDAENFRSLGERLFALGDTAGALRLLSFAAVDPLEGDGIADSLEGRLGPGWSPEARENLLANARAEMRRRVLAESDYTPLQTNVRLVGADGAEHTLGSLMEDGVTLLAYWHRRSFPSFEDLPALQIAAERLATEGINVVTVTEESSSESLTRFLREGEYSFPVFHDEYGEAGAALAGWTEPRYLVIDRLGRERFASSDLRRAVRFALILQSQNRGDPLRTPPRGGGVQ